MGFRHWLIVFICAIYFTDWAQIYDFTKPERISLLVNSSAEESNAVLSEDGISLYFVRTYDTKNSGGIYDQDIWVSRSKNGNYLPPYPLKNLNNKLNNAVISEKRNLNDSSLTNIYLLSAYSADKDLKKGITIASHSKNDSNWIIQSKMPIPDLDIDGKYVGYFLSDDQKVLIFSFEGSDSEGEEDLYYSLYSNDGWSSPEHMGSVINSPGFEISPFLSPKNDTIYFSSNGYKGFGDADIYYSVRKGKWNAWTKPMNLGKTINTANFDAYFSVRKNKAIWSSNREGKDLDIWTAWTIAPPVFLMEYNEQSVSEFQGSDGSIHLTILSGVPPFKYQWSNGATTKDLLNIRKGEYKVTLTDSIGQKIQHVFTINEPPAQEQNLVRFPNVQYEFNKWTFINDSMVNSYDSLKSVARLLQDYPNLLIELISHTDARGDAQMNQILSENRAKACYIYLVQELHIDPRRIIPVGKGESEPAVWYDPIQKTKVILNEEFINMHKDKESLYEYYHQLNRRTEGRVLRIDFDPKTAPNAPSSYLEFQIIPK